MTDKTNPDHYRKHPSGVECITIAEGFNFNLGNVLKYAWRAGLKQGEDPVSDLRKAAWYLQREIDRLHGSTPFEPASYLKDETPVSAQPEANTATPDPGDGYRLPPNAWNSVPGIANVIVRMKNGAWMWSESVAGPREHLPSGWGKSSFADSGEIENTQDWPDIPWRESLHNRPLPQTACISPNQTQTPPANKAT